MNITSEYIVIADFILTEEGLEAGKYLEVRNGYIYDIHDSSCICPGITVLDFRGYSVTPCFSDYHLHLFSHSSHAKEEIVSGLRKYGIKYVYDGGTPDLHALKLKTNLKKKITIKTAGAALYRKGTYGNFVGIGVGDMQDAEKLIDTLAGEGADYIKVINSGVYLPETGDISNGGFECRELANIVGYANKKGLDVVCHANGEERVRDAVEAGVSCIIHGLRVSGETLSQMAEDGITFVPTISAFDGLKKISKKDEAIRNIEEVVASHLLTLKRASDKGVKILPGSDAGASFIPYGSSYYKELVLFQKAGISIEKVLLSAIEERFRKRLKADFLVLDGLRTEKVYINGRAVVSRGKYDSD